jgi:anti-sigma regulatory factor (Ser/Thr protein kinase)
MKDLVAIPVVDESQVGEARRIVAAICRLMNMTETDMSRIAIIVTELATNLVKHGSGGELAIRSIEWGVRLGVELLSLDTGPGIENIPQSMRDGYSTSASPGSGLGAVMRLSSLFDIYSQKGKGAAVMSRFWIDSKSPAFPPRPLSIGAVCLPKKGEVVCGDAWGAEQRGDRIVIIIADGLGHGPDAAVASREAVRLFRKHDALQPAEIVEMVHAGLKKTRGAAVAVAEIDPRQAIVRYVGIGNIAGQIVTTESARSMVSHNGTAGLEARKIQEFTYPWQDNAILIMHSDGLATKWKLEGYPNLINKHPSLIAGVLYRDFKRGTDDVTVVVVKKQEPGVRR